MGCGLQQAIGSDRTLAGDQRTDGFKMAAIPQEKWILFSHQLIWHGRRVCQARKPRCLDCNLEKLCYSKDKTA